MTAVASFDSNSTDVIGHYLIAVVLKTPFAHASDLLFRLLEGTLALACDDCIRLLVLNCTGKKAVF